MTIMQKIGRNDPCSCGSGKKAKNCCLRREPAKPEGGVYDRALKKAFDWLATRHRKDLELALHEIQEDWNQVLGGFEDGLPEDLRETLSILLIETLIGGGEIETSQGRRSGFELVSSPGGPGLGPEEREALEQIATQPLRLYEVVSSAPGSTIELKDALSGETTVAEERTASRQLSRDDVFVTRLLELGGSVRLSGVVLPFPRADLQGLREELRDLERGPREESATERRLANEQWLIDAWLNMLVRRSRIPEIIDAGTGERVILTTDHYRVSDWGKLGARLEKEADVVGSYESGGWTRFDGPDGEGRSLAALNIGRGDRLEAFARTLGLADRGREWLQEVTGELLTFRGRDVVDPREAVRNPELTPGEPDVEGIELSGEQRQALVERIYADWATQRIPALEGKTPRQAIRSRLGRERVIELLHLYEHDDRKSARQENREPVDFGFLWASVGLARPEEP